MLCISCTFLKLSHHLYDWQHCQTWKNEECRRCWLSCRAGYAVPSTERFSASYCIIKMLKREKKGGGLTPDLFPTEHFLWTRLHPSHWPCRIPPNAVPRAMWLRTVYYRNRTILHGQQWEGWSFTRFFFPFPSPCPDWWWRIVSRLRMIAVAPKRDSNNMEENRVNDQNMNAAARSS